MAAGDDNMLRPFTLPSIGQKQVTAGFDGGASVRSAAFCCWPVPAAAWV
jgi:hypothetical protein